MSFSRYGLQHDWKDTISVVHVNVSPGSSAETLVRRGGITSHLLTACCLSNISAKNYQHRLMCVEVIYNVQHQCPFFETQCRTRSSYIGPTHTELKLVFFLSNAMHGTGQIYIKSLECLSVHLSKVPTALDSDRSFCPISLKFEM